MTNAERKTALLDMLANPKRLQKGDKAVEFSDPSQILKAIQEIERQEALESGTVGIRCTFATLNTSG